MSQSTHRAQLARGARTPRRRVRQGWGRPPQSAGASTEGQPLGCRRRPRHPATPCGGRQQRAPTWCSEVARQGATRRHPQIRVPPAIQTRRLPTYTCGPGGHMRQLTNRSLSGDGSATMTTRRKSGAAGRWRRRGIGLPTQHSCSDGRQVLKRSRRRLWSDVSCKAVAPEPGFALTAAAGSSPILHERRRRERGSLRLLGCGSRPGRDGPMPLGSGCCALPCAAAGAAPLMHRLSRA
eukprot:scaffold600_cov385-Prasinococcus_capsulatus_cf.AAC.13